MIRVTLLASQTQNHTREAAQGQPTASKRSLGYASISKTLHLKPLTNVQQPSKAPQRKLR
tara:strand:- start:171 stop:350 length:180 start_codon:yes stop_codon:yes gene_type:complete